MTAATSSSTLSPDQIKAVAFLAQHWPTKGDGQRHQMYMALTGALAWGKVPVEQAEAIVFELATATGDDKIDKRVKMATDTAGWGSG